MTGVELTAVQAALKLGASRSINTLFPFQHWSPEDDRKERSKAYFPEAFKLGVPRAVVNNL